MAVRKVLFNNACDFIILSFCPSHSVRNRSASHGHHCPNHCPKPVACVFPWFPPLVIPDHPRLGQGLRIGASKKTMAAAFAQQTLVPHGHRLLEPLVLDVLGSASLLGVAEHGGVYHFKWMA